MRRNEKGAGYKGLRAGLERRSAPRPRTNRKSDSEFLCFRSLSKSVDSTFTESHSDHFFWLLKPGALLGLFPSISEQRTDMQRHAKARTLKDTLGTFSSPTITQNFGVLDCVNVGRQGLDLTDL